MFSRFINIITYTSTFFFGCIYMYHILHIHQLMNISVDLVIMNNATINVKVLYEYIFSLSYEYTLRVELLDCMGTLYLTLWRMPSSFQNGKCPILFQNDHFTFPPAVYDVSSNFSTFLSTLTIIWLFVFNCPGGY